MREPLRKLEQTEAKPHRDVTLTRRWMDSLGVDMAILFPTPMLHLGLHPQVEIEVALSLAYNRWLVEHVLAEEPRIRTMLYLPFNDPAATYRVVKEFTGKPGVVGFMVTSNRYRPVHHNDYMKTYALLEESNMPLAFHGAYNWNDQSMMMVNRFISAHALGFVWHNIVHLTNWVINGIPERFPKLKVLWIESGLAWLPFIMQRLDNEYMMRTADAPALKRLPSDYIRDMYYTNQPMEKTGDMGLLRDHVPRHQSGDATSLFVRLSALGFRPAERDLRSAVPERGAETRNSGRQCAARVRHGTAEEQARGDGLSRMG